MAIGGMEVFDLKSHFAGKDPSTSKLGKHTREGVQSQKGGVQNTVAKGKGRGYGGPKNLKPHSKKHIAGSSAAKPGLKDSQNEYRTPKDHKDIPSAIMVTSKVPKGSTANTLRKGKDPIWSGYKKGS